MDGLIKAEKKHTDDLWCVWISVLFNID
jgi:hypothetical protein